MQFQCQKTYDVNFLWKYAPMLIDSVCLSEVAYGAVSYLGVFRRHFAPAILSKKDKTKEEKTKKEKKEQYRKKAKCPQPVWLFPPWGKGGSERKSGAPPRVIVPGKLYGPDAHPRPSTEGIPDCFPVTGGGLWYTERIPRGISSSSSSKPLPALRVCPPSAQCRRRSPAWINRNELHDAGKGMDMDSARACCCTRMCVQTVLRAHVRTVVVLPPIRIRCYPLTVQGSLDQL